VYNAFLYEQLQEAHQSYRDLFEDSIDAILISDRGGRIIQANRQATRMAGMTEGELQEMMIEDLHRPDWGVLGESFKHVDEGETLGYESEFGLEDDKGLPIEVQVRKVLFEGNENLQWFMRDISERKVLETLREDLGAMIYHDLRSPLSNVLTSLDMMKTILPLDQDETLKSILAIVDRSASRVHRLVNSLLDINRLETGQSITDLQEVAIQELVAEVIEVVQPVMDSKSQRLVVDLDGEPRIWVDQDMIRRVLVNLVENAVKYSPLDTDVTIRTEQRDGEIVFRIMDQGPGIPPEMREAIFSKFTRLQGENMPKGIGLGLAFCRLAVEAHGGEIWIEGREDGGSVFLFSLPIYTES
jgi:PAS domain S-box-containing protein